MRSPQLPPWTAHRRESGKGSVGARGASAAGMVRCRQRLMLLCRSYLFFCTRGSSSSHDNDRSKLDTFRDARKGQQRAAMPLPYAEQSQLLIGEE